MIFHFKNVGQGDSIVVEWTHEGVKKWGVIDCHIVNGVNPVIEHLAQENVKIIDFIVLSHLHYDHFSGMAGLFEFCLKNKIKVKYFFHTMHAVTAHIYDKIEISQKIQLAVEKLLISYTNFIKTADYDITVSRGIPPFDIGDDIRLRFLSPSGFLYNTLQKQISRKVAKRLTTNADLNKLSTIILFQRADKGVLMTSDAVKKSFNNLTFDFEINLIQVPHHGSWININEKFWRGLSICNDCPAIFSVGDEPKDKLPNLETVHFISHNKYQIHSTNTVYGIKDFFDSYNIQKINNYKSTLLDCFSTLIKTRVLPEYSKLSGNQSFRVFN